MATKTYEIKVRPTPCGIWSSSYSYEFWSAVYDENTGNSYVSLQAVPTGIDILNEDYWSIVSSDYARYAYLKAQLDNLVAEAGDSSNNTELLDIRVALDGTTYDTAGDAVRAQAEDAMKYYFLTDGDGTTYKCYDDMVDGKPVTCYEEYTTIN